MLSENTLQAIYEAVSADPGIDTPMVCLDLFCNDIQDPKHRGMFLAKWLSEFHQDEWETVCDHVDALIGTGHIIFSDAGFLYPQGYQGEIK